MYNEKDAAQMRSGTLKAKTVPEKAPRTRAATAANKVKITSNLKETVSGAEHVWIRKSSRKLPCRQASAVAKKRLRSVYKEDDATIHAENEKDPEDSSKVFSLRRFRSWKRKAHP